MDVPISDDFSNKIKEQRKELKIEKDNCRS